MITEDTTLLRSSDLNGPARENGYSRTVTVSKDGTYSIKQLIVPDNEADAWADYYNSITPQYVREHFAIVQRYPLSTVDTLQETLGDPRDCVPGW